MTEFLTIIANALKDGTCRFLVLSKKRNGCSQPIDKATVRPVVVKQRRRFQITSRYDGREIHENLDATATLNRVQLLFGPAFEHCHLLTADADYSARIRPDGRVTFKQSRPTGQPTNATHNRDKNYLIPDDVPCPFLHEIGVMTAAGKVRAGRYRKFRQINRFLELVDDVVDSLPGERPLQVVDFGCGKSSLTFALYHLLTTIHGREVRVVGLDRNAEVVRDCCRIAERLGCEGLEFRLGDIGDYDSGGKVHLAVSLHACDTATDDALAKAVGWQVDVILAVPCCQHELAHKVHNPALSALTQHGLLKERFAAMVTDALRAGALEICGYRTQVVEFIDLEHTSKNVLIRAVRRETGLENLNRKIDSYRKLKQLLHVDRFSLEESLGADFVKRVGV